MHKLIYFNSYPLKAQATESKLDSIATMVIMEVQERCQCSFIRDRISDEVFRCFPTSPHAVAYRAIIHGTATTNSSKLVSFIKQWTIQGAAIIIQRIVLNVDSSCTVAIPSILFDEECPTMDTTIPERPLVPLTDSDKESSQLSPDSDLGTIIGGITAAVATVIVITIAVIIITMLMLKKCHSNKSTLQSR